MTERALALYVNIKHGNDVVAEHVRCKVYLPIKSVDDLRIKLYPSEDQHDKIQYMWKFSLEGVIKDTAGNIWRELKANNVYWVNSEDEYTQWEADRAEHVRSAEPTDLKITSFRHRTSSDRSQQICKVQGSFWITPHPLFRHVRISKPLKGGGFSVETHHQSRFTLEKGFELAFRQKEHSYKNDDDERVIFSEPVLEFEIDEENDSVVISDELHDYVSDFLVLASFAGRQRCLCVGWDIHRAENSVEFYRRDISIPVVKELRGWINEIIDVADFEEFMNVACRNFSKTKQNEYLRRAINYAIPEEGHPIESNYMLLFAALETLVSHFRQGDKLEKILPTKVAKRMQKELNQWLDNQPLLEVNPEDREKKREFIRDKFIELNRVSFNVALKKFLETYSVDLTDLWPITGNEEGPSLSLIRHKLVHGASFDYRRDSALDCAIENLKWSIERMIISILGWPIERTTLKPQYLSGMTMYKEWREKRESLNKQT